MASNEAVSNSVDGQFTVTARRGPQVLRIERVQRADVLTFDAADRWKRSRIA